MSYSKQSMSGHILEPPKRRPKKFQTLHWSSGCKAAKIGASHPWKCTWTWSPDHVDGRKIETDGPMGSTGHLFADVPWNNHRMACDGKWLHAQYTNVAPTGEQKGLLGLTGLTILVPNLLYVMLQDLESETKCRKLMFHLHDSCRYNWLDTCCFTQRHFFCLFWWDCDCD